MRRTLSPALWMGLALASLGMGHPAQAGGDPVLIEIFTSQGCSSCPPAEDWLNGEGMTLFQQGKIIPLAFHVDYWDTLGWKDAFSSEENTQRQKRYAALWDSSSIYTPQMIVQGKTGFVGSDRDRAKEEIGKAEGKTRKFPLAMKVHPSPSGFLLDLGGAVPKGMEVWAVLFQNGLVTKVGRGENAGRTLTENFVACQWSLVSRDKKGTYQVRFSVSHDTDPKDLGIAVFIQDPSDLGILSAHCLFPLSEKRP